MRTQTVRALFVAASTLALAACGGGGSVTHLPGPASPSSNADLSSLTLSQGILDPAFSPDQTFYVVGPSFFEGLMIVTATTADPDATMTLDAAPLPSPELLSGVPSDPFPLEDSGGFFEIEVTAEDGSTTKSYQFIVLRGAPTGLETYVKASNTGIGDQFGHVVATTTDTVVVGAPFERSNAVGIGGNQLDDSLPEAGAVYVYFHEPAGFAIQAYVKASNTAALDRFGASVAIFGDTLVVGAPLEDSSSVGVNGPQGNDGELQSGAVYVFVRTGTTWTQQAYLKASNTHTGDLFGASVAISGDTIAVGAPGEDSNAAGIDGNQASDTAPDSGAVYLFTRSAGLWSQSAYVKASNAESLDGFGSAVSLSLLGSKLAVGAPLEDSNATGVNGNQGNNAALDSGAAYVFALDEFGWFEEAYVKASNTGTGDKFGTCVSLSTFSFTLPNQDELVLELSTLAVGAPFESSNATGTNGDGGNDLSPASGAAYVFKTTSPTLFSTEWEQEAYLKALNTGTGDHFGSSIAAVYGTVVVGAPNEASDAGGLDGDMFNDLAGNSGAAYVFFDSGGATWEQESYVKASNARIGDVFATSVALVGGTLVVGAESEDSEAVGIGGNQAGTLAPGSGAAYIIR